MDNLLTYINSLPVDERDLFAMRCETTIGYLRKACSIGQRLGESACVLIERATLGAVTCESLRDDVAWVRIQDPDWPHPLGRPLVDHSVKLGASETAPLREAA